MLHWGFFYLIKNAFYVFSYRSNKSGQILKKKVICRNPERRPELAIRSIEIWAGFLRPEPNCLVQALSLRDLLARCGHQAEIRLAARKIHQEKFEFHAVVFLHQKPIFGVHGGWQNALQLRSPEEATL